MTTETPHDSRLFTALELAELWNISRASLYNLLNAGMPSVQIGRLRRFDPMSCRQWLADQQREAA